MDKFSYEVLFHPGNYFTKKELDELTTSLGKVASECFDEIPCYQVLTGRREEYRRAIIALARNKAGEIVGFCSSLVLNVPGAGEVLHLGLTCVSPSARGRKLTHKLSSKLILQYLLKEAPIDGTWITNCACVLSSLGNVALYFENIYPSPYGQKAPSSTHLNIGRGISQYFRGPIAINDDANFNEKTFIFEGSVKNAVFEKSSSDKRFHHRDKEITKFYQEALSFERGDEVLQVGRISLLTFPKYLWSTSMRRLKRFMTEVDNGTEKYARE